MNRILLFCFLLLGLAKTSYSQSPLWGFNVGSSSNDIAFSCKTAPNGNVCITGSYTGTMDLDPGPGVYNITGTGFDDIFVACYSPTGSFLWGFGFGGPGYDAALYITTDVFSNVLISGYYQSAGIDFDPGPGTTTLGYVGGTGLPYEGDGFVAKYSSTGVFQWAKDLGGPTVYDFCYGLAVDDLGYVYVGGEFINTMVVSGSITFSSGTAGTGYIIKYDPAGTVIWAHNFGEFGTAGVDCAVYALQVSNGFIYASGTFRGVADFNPWGTPAILSAPGGGGDFEGFIAKYDTAGNFVFAKQVGGTGTGIEYVGSLALDGSDNIYFSGWSSSPIFTAAGGPAITTPGGGGNFDIFMGKYNSSGLYQWGTVLGNTGDDHGYCVDISGGFLYSTGNFTGTVDMDPSAVVSNLTGGGGTDIFVTKYDLNGNYICGFGVGAGASDKGWGLTHDLAGNIYSAGQFGGTAVDFDPSAGTFPLTSNGSTDAYLVKYAYVSAGAITGSLTGDTICNGQPAQITVNITSGGAGPFNVTYTDGVTTYTQTGVMSGVPFTLAVSPTVTTTYTLISISVVGAGICNPPSGSGFGTATVLVRPTPVVTITPTLTNCNTFSFSSIGSDSLYNWSFGDGAIGTGNPVSHLYTVIGTETVVLTQTNTFNCTGAGSVSVTTYNPPVVNLGPDTVLCSGGAITLQSSVTYTTPAYLWSTGSGAATIAVSTSGIYWLRVTEHACPATDTINVTFNPTPVVNLGNDTGFCDGGIVVLSSPQPPGATYLWSTGSTADTIHVSTTGTYWLRVTNGCSAEDTINVAVSPAPVVNLGPDTSQCHGISLLLHSSVPYTSPTYLWNTSATTATYVATLPGTYWLTVNDGGCSGSDTVNIIAILDDTMTLYSPDIALCRGDSYRPVVTGNPLIYYQWTPTAGIALPNTGMPLITPDTSAMYTITGFYPGCPDIVDSFYIDVQPVPDVYLGGNKALCKFDTVHLHASVSPNWYTHYTYSWTPATFLDDPTVSTVIFKGGDSSKLVLTVTTPIGCKGVDSALMIVYPGNFAKLDTSVSVCPRDSVQLTATGGASYRWHPGLYLSDSTLPDPWVHAITTQSYSVVATSQHGCKDTVMAKVTVYPNAILHLGDSVKIFPGEEYHIPTQTNCVTFTWFPPAGLSDYTAADPIAKPLISTSYTVHGLTEWGCKASDSISIYYDLGALVALPNAFTPGSSVNSKFQILKRGDATLHYFRVFNRWGNMVFETANIDEGWDGTYNGKPQPFGVFVYQVEAVSNTGLIFRKSGNVTLIR